MKLTRQAGLFFFMRPAAIQEPDDLLVRWFEGSVFRRWPVGMLVAGYCWRWWR